VTLSVSVTMCTHYLIQIFLFIDIFAVPFSDLDWVFIFLFMNWQLHYYCLRGK
jgi:hypothetical protein